MNLVLNLSDTLFTCTCVIRLFSIALFLTSLEYLAVIGHFGDKGLYSWKMIRLNTPASLLKLKLNPVFNKTGMLIIFSGRFICSIYLLAVPVSIATVFLLSFIVITSFLLSIRNPVGNDGSDQMAVIISVSLLIAFIFNDHAIAALSLYFIAAQSVISYMIAGVAKLLSKTWRSGTAVYQVMNTESFGSEKVAKLLFNSSPALKMSLAWGVMLFETLFFVVLVLPYPYFFGILILGVAFHFYNAVIMGLNNFFWVFLATYPAIIYTNLALYHYFSR
jgi:hypothetical protein